MCALPICPRCLPAQVTVCPHCLPARRLSATVRLLQIHNFLIAVWAVVLFVTGVFLVEWGVSFADWVLPISSTFLSFAFLLGWLPYETFAGILFVLAARPYDIGDRIAINDPGTHGHGRDQFTVSDIGLLSTRLVSLTGEEHNVQVAL
jgi:small-conductance mechanosensitive channel